MNLKKFTLPCLIAIFALACSGSAAAQGMYGVWQDTDADGMMDTFLGRIEAFTGTESSIENYNYYSASYHQLNGPTAEAYKSKLYMYEGSDGLSLGFFHNRDDGGGNYWNHVKWDIDFLNINHNLAFVDDSNPENRGEIGIVPDLITGGYDAGWAYIQNTDGGIVNDLAPTDEWWEIIIDPSEFGDIQKWVAASGDGNDISLWNSGPVGLPGGLGRTDDFYLATNANTTYITPIPEPATMLLLGTGLLGGVMVRRKRKA